MSSWEDIAHNFCQQVQPEFLIEQLHCFAGGSPHSAGSHENEILGENIAANWRSWGIPKVIKQEFYATIPLPPPTTGPWNEVVLLSAEQQPIYHAKNYVEVPPQSDRELDIKTKRSISHRFPAYTAYSASGSKCGPFVFANYGRPEDLELFDRLQERHLGEPSLFCSPNLVVICRLGLHHPKSTIRALLNHCTCGSNGTPLPNHHPAALILYPDPHDQSIPHQPVYPNGSSLPGDAPVFRHVCMSKLGGGNPNTRDLPSSANVYEEDAMVPGAALASLLVQPIGFDDAQVLLSYLVGPSVPPEWKQCIATAIGPSSDCMLSVTIRNRVSDTRVRLTNVLGILPGDPMQEEADHYVVVGNHRDAWVQGACDPGSGTIIVQQIAKILGTAYKKGFRPRRSIVLASWDGEEISLLGSTHASSCMHYELQNRAVAYINADCPVKGTCQFNARTDSLLADVLLTACRLVQIDPPVNTVSFFDEWTATEGVPLGGEPHISAPGTGSDHIPFQYKLGVPSSYPEFLPNYGLSSAPTYHTAYDTIDYVKRFIDPCSSETGQFPRHRLIVRILLTMIVQLACCAHLPYAIQRWTDSLTAQWRKFIEQSLAQVPDLVKFGIHLEWITEALFSLAEAAKSFEELTNTYKAHDDTFPSIFNRVLVGLPKIFIRPPLECATSYPHVLYHPHGYQNIYFPRVRSALDDFTKRLSSNAPYEVELETLKRELSVLAVCLDQATSWLRNGLIGFGNKQLDQK